MKLVALILVGGLSFLSAHGAPAATNPDPAAKAHFLLGQLQSKISTMRTTGTVDLTAFKRSRIYGDSSSQEWDTYYRCGNPHFRSRLGFGTDITPQRDSIAVMPGDSLYLGLTVAPTRAIVASDNSIDLAPYLPGCRLYVFYRSNILGQSAQSGNRRASIEYGIYRIIAVQLADVGVRIPSAHS